MKKAARYHKSGSWVLSEEEYVEQLHKKLRDEVEKYLLTAKTEELADILELVYALAETHQCSREELESLRRLRVKKQGVGKEKIFLRQNGKGQPIL